MEGKITHFYLDRSNLYILDIAQFTHCYLDRNNLYILDIAQFILWSFSLSRVIYFIFVS